MEALKHGKNKTFLLLAQTLLSNMLKYKRYIINICLVLMGSILQAQPNLVQNGSFEIYSLCPTQLSNTSQQLALATGWIVPTSGTPDYFNTCAAQSTNIDIPNNTYGNQTARTGNAYAGFYAYTNPSVPLENTREYLQMQLSQTLIAGKTYYFKMYVNLANSPLFRMSVSNIGAYFSNTAINKLDNGPFIYTPQIVSNTFLTDTANWTEISGSFIANGGEGYVTIGRFGVDNTLTTKLLIGDNFQNSAYYYIDDISLIDSCFQYNALTSILGTDATYDCVTKPMQVALNVQNAITTNYVWNTNEATPNITVSTPGTYWVKMTSGKCFAIDTVKILGKTKPVFTLGNDTSPCFNSSLLLKPKITSDSTLAYIYRWTKRVGNSVFELGNSTQFSINYPDQITLELSNNGCKNQDTIVIHPSSLKQAHLSADTAICRNTRLTLNGQTQGALHYVWSSGETTPVIQTKNQLMYWVNAMDSFCSSIDTILYSIKGPANYLNDTVVCGKQTMVLTGDPLAINQLWSTGELTLQKSIQTGGIYVLRQQKDGCTVWDSVSITMNDIPYSDLGGDTLICVDPVYELKANSPLALSYIWDSGDTTSSIILQKSGKYAVTTFNKNCSYRDSVLIQAQINTPFSFGGDQFDCFSEPIILNPKAKRIDQLLWSDGSTNRSLTITKPGTYWLKVTSGVCVNSDTITFFPKDLPTVELGNDTVLCLGNKLLLDAQDSGFSYIWNTGADSRIIEVAKTGFYFVEKRTIEGCYATDSIKVQFVAGFELFKKHHWNVCADSSTIIKPKEALISYLWSDQSTLPTLKVTTAGAYWLEATDSIGCTVLDTVIVDQFQKPEVTMDSLILTCDFPLTLAPEGSFKSYLWSVGSKDPAIEVKGFGVFYLTVTDSIGCKTKTSVEVKNNCPPGVTMTNVFTPNHDGLNDIIIPQYEHIKSTYYNIRNRWGNLVFETSDVKTGWDGLMQNGQEAPAGVYYYTVECDGLFSDHFSAHGSITLIR